METHQLNVGHGAEDAQVGGVPQRVPVADLDGRDAHQRSVPVPAGAAAGARPARTPTMRVAAATPEAQAPWIAPKVSTVHASPAKKMRSATGCASTADSARSPGARPSTNRGPRGHRPRQWPCRRRMRRSKSASEQPDQLFARGGFKAVLGFELGRIVAPEVGQQDLVASRSHGEAHGARRVGARDEVHRAFERERARLHLDEDLVRDAEGQAGEGLPVGQGQRRRERRLAAGEQGGRHGDDDGAALERALLGGHAQVAAPPVDGRDRALEDHIQSARRAGDHGAQALADRPVDVGILRRGEVDGRQVRQVHAHRPAHDRVEQRPELQILRHDAGGRHVVSGPGGSRHRLDRAVPVRVEPCAQLGIHAARDRSTGASPASARSR